MRIDHIAIWTKKLEKMKHFYETYFQGKSGEKYINPRKNFESYFVEFDSGTRLELMEKLEVDSKLHDDIENYLGITHFAISTSGRKEVDHLTERLRTDGFKIIGEPRVTGDGFYESVVLDPDGNKVEITE
ncbi:MAG: VOC family protein [Cyclobacteriaceae bacterium]|nr:VOC family protein [Cyclobacteriaceae bacterium]